LKKFSVDDKDICLVSRAWFTIWHI